MNYKAVDLRMTIRLTGIGMFKNSSRTLLYHIEPQYTWIYPYMQVRPGKW